MTKWTLKNLPEAAGRWLSISCHTSGMTLVQLSRVTVKTWCGCLHVHPQLCGGWRQTDMGGLLPTNLASGSVREPVSRIIELCTQCLFRPPHTGMGLCSYTHECTRTQFKKKAYSLSSLWWHMSVTWVLEELKHKAVKWERGQPVLHSNSPIPSPLKNGGERIFYFKVKISSVLKHIYTTY